MSDRFLYAFDESENSVVTVVSKPEQLHGSQRRKFNETQTACLRRIQVHKTC